jgi:release factor glutamine methyltransferase
MKITDLLRDAASRLAAANIDGARLDAEVLLAFVLGTDRAGLYARDLAPLSDGDRARFADAVRRRADGCPVAFITGMKEFWSIPIAVTQATLIPRPDTETVVHEALALFPDRRESVRILDLCAGSGCIAAALAQELPASSITVADLSAAALDVARGNLAFAGDRALFLAGDLFTALPEGTPPFDLITANPPYIPRADYERLPREIRDFEPADALVGGENGLDFVSRIIEDAPRFLVPGGWLAMELGQGQSGDGIAMATASGAYDTIRTAQDLAGIERVVMARRSRY